MKTTSHRQQGFTLLEGIVALSILTSLLVLGTHYIRQRLKASQHQQAAAHLRRVTAAAVRYAQDHTDYLGSTIKQDKAHENSEEADWKQSQKKHQDKKDDPISLEVWRYKKLLKGNYLPEFSPHSERNLYGQGYALYILKAGEPTTITQLLVLTTGGTQLPEGELRQIARQTGGQGGYISKQNKTQVTGSQQGWKLALPAETLYLSSPNKDKEKKHYESPGHLACLHTLHPDDRLHAQFLHRTPQPNRPQLNQMETDLGMQSHQIVFKKQEPTGTTSDLTLNANYLQFKHHGSLRNQTIKLGYDEMKKRTAFEINDHQEGGVVIEANRVTTTGEPDVSTAYKENYSAPELNAYWNKVPYYESPDPTSVTWLSDLLCSKNRDNQHRNTEERLGRLFMIGCKKSQATFLYLCGYNNTEQGTVVVPHLIAEFQQEAKQIAQPQQGRSQAALHSTQLLSLLPSPASTPPSSLSPKRGP